jgi:hypothetical protein
MKQCSQETAGCAGNSETQKDAFMRVLAYACEAERRGDQMRNGHSGYGELRSDSYGQQGSKNAADPEARDGSDSSGEESGHSH